jgi:hypothetical protein
MNNPYRVIKRLAFVTGFCIVSCTTALAQQSLFLFLQSDNLQPFYVQMGDKVYSSSSTGHVIISGLQDNTCNFEVGFPQRTSRPQHFSIPLNNKDHGYQLIKNGADWALYDWQTKETIEPLKGSDNNMSLLYGERKKDDAFATLMAAVVNDSAVLYTSIVKKDVETVPQVAKTTEPEVTEKQPQPTSPVSDTVQKAVETKAETKTETVKTEPVNVTPPAIDSAKLVKTEPSVTRNTAAVTNTTPTVPNNVSAEPIKDTLAAKYDPKEKPLSEASATNKGSVVKVQQQTKDGETKMVFVDSSTSPADVITVYITEDKSAPAVTPQAATNTATGTGQSPVSTTSAPSLSKEDVKKAAADTVTIILESPQMKKDSVATPAKQDAAVTTKPAAEKSAEEKPVTKSEPGKLEPKASTDSVKKTIAETKPVEPEKKAEPGSKLVMINSDCVRIATDNDVDKMRVKMLAENDNQKRITIANKYFKTMCLYARQIKALTELFPTSESKYQFLQVAYPFAADTANFKQLYDLFPEEDWQNKFKTMVHYQ